jgi:hypothetical protein
MSFLWKPPSIVPLSGVTSDQVKLLGTMVQVEEKTGLKPTSIPDKSSSLSESSLEGGQFEINEKALLRKLDYRLLPPLTILYLLSFLDRSNGT